MVIPTRFPWSFGRLQKMGPSENIPNLVSNRDLRPSVKCKPTQVEWFRLGELALWKVHGYCVQSVHSVDWETRQVTWNVDNQEL